MKRILVVCFLLITGFAWSQNIPAKPNPPRLVNDFANVLTADQKEALERKLVAYDDSTSTQIVIVTVQSTEGVSVEDYAIQILRDWGVGNKKTNNGIVLLAAIKDRKIRIETGYGLEGAIPDITAQQIIKNEIGPNFRSENYYRGFDEAVDAIIKAAAGQYKAPDNYRDRGTGNRGGGIIGIVVIFIIIIVAISRRNRGGGGGGMINRGGFLPWLILNSMMNSGGGGRGGGDWGGGGGGGGFGGFGGGSGGGGGASGSW